MGPDQDDDQGSWYRVPKFSKVGVSVGARLWLYILPGHVGGQPDVLLPEQAGQGHVLIFYR